MAVTTIKTCRVCESSEIETFLDLGLHPFANAFLKNNSDAEKKYPLTLSFCHDCSLVQLNETADPKELFSNYVWVTGTSSTAKAYAARFCEEVLSFVKPPSNDGTILEVASNDGTFLKEFTSKGRRVLGIEPAANIAALANSQGVPTECAFFGLEAARGIETKHGRPHVIIARNVLPHVANLHDFMKGFEALLAPDGWLVLEVHDAEAILRELHYDSVYHEHLCYFSLQSLKKLLDQYGFKIAKILSSPISGGSLVVFAGKKAKEAEPRVSDCEESNDFQNWGGFARKTHLHRERLLTFLDEEKRQQKRIVGYGASARSSTLLNFCGIDTRYLAAIADQNPIKNQLLTPGTRIPVQSPDAVMAAKPDTILVLAWNFFAEIRNRLREKYQYPGLLLKPLPVEPKFLTA